jgi:hypothetical protein
MRVTSVRIGDACLRGAICLGSGVEGSHPADLVSARVIATGFFTARRVRELSRVSAELLGNIF